jgi:hypothetical protein
MASDLWTPKGSVAFDADELDRKRKHAESQAALIFALLIGAFAAFGIFLIANSERAPQPSNISDCSGLEPGATRLARFDKLVRERDASFKATVSVRSEEQR